MFCSEVNCGLVRTVSKHVGALKPITNTALLAYLRVHKGARKSIH